MHLVHVSGGSFPQATASYTCRRRKTKPLEWEDIVKSADVSVCSENYAGANKQLISNGHKFERKKINNQSVKADFQHRTFYRELRSDSPTSHTAAPQGLPQFEIFLLRVTAETDDGLQCVKSRQK